MTVLASVEFSFGATHRLRLEDPLADAQASLFGLGPPVAQAEQGPSSGTVPAMEWKTDPGGLLEPFRLREDADYLIGVLVPGDADAVATARKADATWPFRDAGTAKRVSWHSRATWKSDGAGGTWFFGRLRFGSYVGVADLTLHGGTPLLAEVAARKITYEQDFRELITAVGDELMDLLVQIRGATGLAFETTPLESATPAIALFHLRRLMRDGELPQALEEIAREPHSRLDSRRTLQPISLASSVDPVEVVRSAGALDYASGGPLARMFLEKSPTELPETERFDTVDTPENRYIKDFLARLALRCDDLLHTLEKEDPARRREVARWLEVLNDLAEDPIWRQVGPLRSFPSNSQVLLRRSSYRTVLQADALLDEGLALPWQRGEEISRTLSQIRPIFELYEYWCFFVLRGVLRDVCTAELPASGTAYKLSSSKFSVDLKRGKQSRVSFMHQVDGAALEVDLFYNRTFTRPASGAVYGDVSYSAAFKPDYSIRVKAPTGDAAWLLFDAKYRLDADQWQEQVDTADDDAEDESDIAMKVGGTFKRADLYKIHAYRDGILGTRGSFVLYPGTDAQSVYVRNRDPAYRFSEALPAVGAFPLRPGGPATQRSELAQTLSDVLSGFAAGRSYIEETGFV